MMAWDIYGNKLRNGYCEVHPDVPEEYPCHFCRIAEAQEQKNQSIYRIQEQEYYKAMEDQHRHEVALQKSIKYNILVLIHDRLSRLLAYTERKKQEIIGDIFSSPELIK